MKSDSTGEGERGVSTPKELLEEARSFLLSQKWCNGIQKISVKQDWGGLVAIYWARIEPGQGADPTMWVIVGDLPPAYIDTHSCPTADSALEAYVNLMQEWADKIIAGESIEDCIPVLRRGSLVPIPPTEEYARMLEGRLDLIRKHILKQPEEGRS